MLGENSSRKLWQVHSHADSFSNSSVLVVFLSDKAQQMQKPAHKEAAINANGTHLVLHERVAQSKGQLELQLRRFWVWDTRRFGG